MPGITEVEAAEFAEYLRDERERRRRTAGVSKRSAGMYHRAMMRAYAESIGIDRELAVTPCERSDTAEQTETPPTAAAPEPVQPLLGTPPAQTTASAMLATARPSLSPRRKAPARHLVGAAALALFAVAGALIWSLAPTAPASPSPQHRLASAQASEVAPQRVIARPATPTVLAVTPARRSAPQAPQRVRRNVAQTAGIPQPHATEGTLSITSQPSGARVTVNGIGWGETPVTIRHLEFGQKRIRLTLQGYMSEERLAHLTASEPAAAARFVLRRRPAPPVARSPVAGAAERR